jgi:hypothetical protein
LLERVAMGIGHEGGPGEKQTMMPQHTRWAAR